MNPDQKLFELYIQKFHYTFDPEIRLEKILRTNTTLCIVCFAIADHLIKVQASALMDQITVPILKEIILEVATTADRWELELTGKDVH